MNNSLWVTALLTLLGGVGVGRAQTVGNEQIADDYQPFEDGVSSRRIRAGLSWRPR